MNAKELRDNLAMVAKTGEVANIRAAVKALDEAEKAEAKALKAKADAKWAEQSAARTELTQRLEQSLGEVSGKFRTEILKVVGEDEALLRFTIDYKAKTSSCSIVRTVAKARGTGNGKHGKIQALFEQYATAGERAALAKAIEDARVEDALCRVDAIEWKHRTNVKKRLLLEGTIQAE